MNSFIKIIFIIILFAAVEEMTAQSALYFCKDTGAFGYTYSAASLEEAENMAYNNCKEFGGVNIKKIASTSKTGWGVIAVGTTESGTRALGVALGYDDMEEAKRVAKKYCEESGGQEITYFDFWRD